MGKFANDVRDIEAVPPSELCVIGRYVKDNFDEEDTAEFVRLVGAKKWEVIFKMTGMQPASMRRHGGGHCRCPEGAPGRGGSKRG